MFVFYEKATGSIVFTLEGEGYPPHLITDTVDVITTQLDLGEISCWRVENGAPVRFTIAPIQARYLGRVNAMMTVTRTKFITALPAQDMIYLRKETEALAYVADPAPDMANYPFLWAEIGVTAPDAWSVAQVWLYMSAMWRGIAAQLEGIRITAVNAIEQASTEDGAELAFAAFETHLGVFD